MSVSHSTDSFDDRESNRPRGKKRGEISASLRWSVFARDGFMCRYCGAQAGQDGVELHADHVLSKAEGGDNSFDNLVTACNRCNGGKGARSLQAAPTSAQVIDRLNDKTRTLLEQADAIAAALNAQKVLVQEAVNLKCAAYEATSVHMEPGEETVIINLCREFGADRVLEWFGMAFSRGVNQCRAIKYVCGIARNLREQEGTDA